MSNVDIAVKYALDQCSQHNVLLSDNFFGDLSKGERKAVHLALLKKGILMFHQGGTKYAIAYKSKISGYVERVVDGCKMGGGHIVSGDGNVIVIGGQVDRY